MAICILWQNQAYLQMKYSSEQEGYLQLCCALYLVNVQY